MKFFFNIIINLLATVIQIVTLPLNAAISAALPDISDKITQVTNGISALFTGMGWALGLIPPGIKPVLSFILAIEISKHTIFVSTHALIKVWNLFQKLKFW